MGGIWTDSFNMYSLIDLHNCSMKEEGYYTCYSQFVQGHSEVIPARGLQTESSDLA